MSSKKSKKIIIEGVTPEGKTFRPSDWAVRMSEVMASFKNSRVYYSPLLQPGVNPEGLTCIIIDPKLKESSPEVYKTVMDFAKTNRLKISDKDKDNDDQ